MRRRIFDPAFHDLSGPIKWLRGHGLTPSQVSDVLSVTPNLVNVTLHRSREDRSQKLIPLLMSLDNRAVSFELNSKTFTRLDREIPSLQSPRRIRKLEQEINDYNRHFWKGVPYLRGTSELGRFLQRLSRPASDNISSLRLVAQIYYLECETHLHAGYAASALHFGLGAYGYSEYIYRQTRNSTDLKRLAKTALLISNSCISRRDIARAGRWLTIARQAFAASSSKYLKHPDPEYLRQLASTQRHTGTISEARKNLTLAAQVLPDYEPDTTTAAVKDMGDRVLHVIADTPEWDESRALMHVALQSWPVYDSHRASNVNWTAACGLLTDSPDAQREALQFLETYRHVSDGFGLQSSTRYLLSLTPRVPDQLRHDWVLFALSYNAYRNK